jgi:hypothetical protein
MENKILETPPGGTEDLYAQFAFSALWILGGAG